MVEDFFTQLIEVRRRQDQKNSFGASTSSYLPLAQIRGFIRALTGSEGVRGGKLFNSSTHRLYCSPADLTTADKVVFDGHEYDVCFIQRPLGANFLEVDLELVK